MLTEMSCYPVPWEIMLGRADNSNRMPLADALAGMSHFSIERDYLLRDSAAGLSIDFMNRDALFGDPLANYRVDHRASANRACSRSVGLTWI